MSEQKENVTVEDIGAWAKWFRDNKRWIWPTVMFVAGGLGLNLDRVEDFLPTLPTDKTVVERLDKVEKRVEVLTLTVGKHEEKLFPLEGSPNEEESSPDSGEKPVYRE